MLFKRNSRHNIFALLVIQEVLYYKLLLKMIKINTASSVLWTLMDLNLTDFQGRTLINPQASEADFKISIDDQQFHMLFNLHSLLY